VPELVDHDGLAGLGIRGTELRAVEEREALGDGAGRGSPKSGPENPSTPESAPNSSSKIAPLSSYTMALRPSGAGASRKGSKLVSSTSTERSAPWT